MPAPTDDSSRVLTVLTVNTHKGFTSFNRRFMLHDLRKALRTAAPDVVFLQEVLGEHQAHAERHSAAWPALSQYEFLADTLWTDFAYGRNAVYPAGHHGNAILSRYPIERYENHDVSVDGHEGRGLLHCVLRVPGSAPVHAICVHLGLLERHRGQQLNGLCELVSRDVPAGEPLLIAGDFNDWRLNADRLMADCGTQEVFTTRLGRPARTFPARWPLLRLDRIYVRSVRDWRPVPLAARVWSRLSDHVPISAEIAL